MSLPAKFLDWDSAFFGRRIGRVTSGSPSPDEFNAVMAWAAAQEMDGMYFLCAGDPASIRLAEAHGFHLTDVRVTLDCAIPADPRPVSGTVTIRHALPEDRESLRTITRGSYTDSRFYADPHFTREQCDALYDRWITRSLDGGAAAVLVAEKDDRVSGYITCENEADTGHIGLVAVDSASRGGGVGMALTQASLMWFAAQPAVKRVEVVTQGRNIAAQRTYGACGFRTRALELWYHWWREEKKKPE